MSAELEAADEVCASCGKVEVGDVKLKICTACKLVKYCGVDCQKNHRPQHKKACKKRMAEIRDDRLFRQPDESHLGECPLCCLPLSLDMDESVINNCCSKFICTGCFYADDLRQREAELEQHRCPFCREPVPDTDEENEAREMERVKSNDPVAICGLGKRRYREGDYREGFEYCTKAAALGDMDAHHQLALAYMKGEGVEKDNKKHIYHLEEAAIGGHAKARFHLGLREGERGRNDRMMKHLIIAANLGDDEALEGVKVGFMNRCVSKEDYEAALRGHQAAVDATKSQQRDAAAAAFGLASSRSR
jgi:hypothetical protein